MVCTDFKLFKLSENFIVSNPPAEEQKITEDKIVQNVPKTYQAKAKKLIAHLKEYTGVTWNNNGEWSSTVKTCQTLTLTIYNTNVIYQTLTSTTYDANLGVK